MILSIFIRKKKEIKKKEQQQQQEATGISDVHGRKKNPRTATASQKIPRTTPAFPRDFRGQS